MYSDDLWVFFFLFLIFSLILLFLFFTLRTTLLPLVIFLLLLRRRWLFYWLRRFRHIWKVDDGCPPVFITFPLFFRLPLYLLVWGLIFRSCIIIRCIGLEERSSIKVGRNLTEVILFCWSILSWSMNTPRVGSWFDADVLVHTCIVEVFLLHIIHCLKFTLVSGPIKNISLHSSDYFVSP